MTCYEKLHVEAVRLNRRKSLLTVLPSVGIALLLACWVYGQQRCLWSAIVGLLALAMVPHLLHTSWMLASKSYRACHERGQTLNTEMLALKAKMAELTAVYPKRRKGEQFKRAFDLTGRETRELESALSVGMYREAREVFVTAFMRRGVAVRVTASIGSPYRCSPADNPTNWANHVTRLNCDEIRQYHNHPAHDGKTKPSSADYRASIHLTKLLGVHGQKLRSLIICWNPIQEWKVIEYDAMGRHWLHHEFDAAEQPAAGD